MHQYLKVLVQLAPTLKKLFPGDPMIAISDREKVICHIHSKELVVQDSTGHMLERKDPMYESIQYNKIISMQVPKEVYGFSFRVTAVPILDENRQVIGCISASTTLDRQENLIQVAEQMAASSEEISASTTELSSSAKDLTNLMNELKKSLNEMTDQMNQTEKILEMINSIAKSSRILGLNAGIEAARSGEYGKGFSIVAKEITKLADQIAHSVEQIRQLLNLVKDKVNNVDETVGQTVNLSENQLTAITEISEAIHHLTSIAEDVEDLARKI